MTVRVDPRMVILHCLLFPFAFHVACEGWTRWIFGGVVFSRLKNSANFPVFTRCTLQFIRFLSYSTINVYKETNYFKVDIILFFFFWASRDIWKVILIYIIKIYLHSQHYIILNLYHFEVFPFARIIFKLTPNIIR